jgi:hypothetical protein
MEEDEGVIGVGSASYKLKKEKGQLFPCDRCPKIYRSPACLGKHSWSHSLVRSFPCAESALTPRFFPGSSPSRGISRVGVFFFFFNLRSFFETIELTRVNTTALEGDE